MSNEISKYPSTEIFSGVKNASVNQVLFLRDQQNYSEQRGNFEATAERAWSFTINRSKEFNNDNDNVQSLIDETIDAIVHTTLDNVIEQVVSETERNVSKQKLDELSEISLKYADEYKILEYADEYEVLKCGEEEDDEDNAINTRYQNQKSLQAYNDFDENMEKEMVVIEDSSSDFLPYTYIQVATNLFHTVQSCITFLISGIILWIFIKEVAKIYSPIFDFFFLEKNTKAQKIENNVNDDLDDRSKPIEKSNIYLISTHDTNGLSSNGDLYEKSKPIEKSNSYLISTHATNVLSSNDNLDDRSKPIEKSNIYLISTHDTNVLSSNDDLDGRSKPIEKSNSYLISTHDTNVFSSNDDLDGRSKPIEKSNGYLISTHDTNVLSSNDDLDGRNKPIEKSNSYLISTHDTNVLSSNDDLEKSNSYLISTHDTNVFSSNDDLDGRSKLVEKSNSYLISTHDKNGLSSNDDLDGRSKPIEKSNSYLISTHDTNVLSSNDDLEKSNSYLISTHDTNVFSSNDDLDGRSKPIEKSNGYLISTHDTNGLSSNDDLDGRSKPIEKSNSYLISTHDTNVLSSEINAGCSNNYMDKSDKNKPEDYPQIISETVIQDNQNFDEEDNILDQILDRNSDLMPIDEEVNMHDYIFDRNDDLIPTEHNLSNDENYSHYSYFANAENGIHDNNNNKLCDYISNNNNKIRYISNNNNNNSNELRDYISNNNNNNYNNNNNNNELLSIEQNSYFTNAKNEIHDNNNLRDYISNNNKIRFISKNNNNNELLPIEHNSPNYKNQNEINDNQNIYLDHEEDYMQDCIPDKNDDLISTEQNLLNNEKNENASFYSHFTSEENNIIASVPEKTHYETSMRYSEKQNLISRLPQKRIRITRSKSKLALLQKDATSNMSLEEKKQLLNKVRQKKMMLEKDLKTVTKENTNRNKEYLCDLDVVVVHKDGFRPPSPTTKLPIKSKKSKTTSFIPVPKSRHGQKERNDNSEENGENGRGVHWDEEKLQLFSPRIMSSPSVAKQKPIPKSCLKQPNRITDSFGNVFDANESLIPSLQRGMKVKVTKIKYQDDDE
ncbi:hypothetical protein Glove_292g62 [Diversispora epigaea]|uniref:Uncharacterized protein n=1 Tax=Diversispora epigaea TaxID=1348612 RepID=A0A397I692_9GLOM|nr:hypothetical protein Glove_292g62 [Diversispora epigaea]